MDRGKQVLRSMQRQGHRRQRHDTGGALEGVEGSKGAIDPLGRKTVALHRDEIVGGLVDEFAGLDDELLVEGVHGGAPVKIAT